MQVGDVITLKREIWQNEHWEEVFPGREATITEVIDDVPERYMAVGLSGRTAMIYAMDIKGHTTDSPVD